MAKAGARLNKGTIAKILKTVDGGKRAAADRIMAEIDTPGAEVDVYVTDREVVAIRVPFEHEALHGAATRAAGRAGIRRGKP